ncbi:MAG TPA: M28 family peptidase [Bryobacteraceae bacterium]|jgi:Zn-dependent M28 family amino/carboxypeptidase|nr:M28 family peptidase [Bryobacteraceae bacterium]
MLRRAAIGIFLTSFFSLVAPAASFSGTSALEFTRRITAYGPHASGSTAIGRVRAYVEAQAKTQGWSVTEDSFVARTPNGPVKMANIVAHLTGHTSRALVFTGHYDTRARAGFLGANDGGSSAGFLLELARVLPRENRNDDIYLVWFDGEEAVREWTDTDSLYGSRHMVRQWANDGTLARIKALINVDMIGDKDLDILRDGNSSPALNDLLLQTARSLGYGQYFQNDLSRIEDDHLPFRQAGVDALDIIDYDYGPNNSYWHTNQDTMDKLSAHSLEAVGAVLLEMRRRLD